MAKAQNQKARRSQCIDGHASKCRDLHANEEGCL
jgi:hypothetical protein